MLPSLEVAQIDRAVTIVIRTNRSVAARDFALGLLALGKHTPDLTGTQVYLDSIALVVDRAIRRLRDARRRHVEGSILRNEPDQLGTRPYPDQHRRQVGVTHRKINKTPHSITGSPRYVAHAHDPQWSIQLRDHVNCSSKAR